MDRRAFSRALGVVLIGSIAAGTAACSKKEETSDAQVTISVNGLPPETDAANRKLFMDDVKAFEAANPKIKIDAREGFMDPQTFQAKLAGGQLEDVFYVYFTDPANLIAKKQVADITPYLKDFPVTSQIRPDLLKVFSGSDGKVYGLPRTNYSMGLLYNRKLYTAAGLDPDKPPTDWAGVRENAKKIAALGNGTVGYGDYSKSNTGGWHFTAEIYSQGGDIAVKEGDTWKAAFNSAQGKAVLQNLKDMRWTDNSMGEKQLLEWADLVTMFGSGKLGQYVATSDNITAAVNNFGGVADDYGLAPIPGGKATLGGGDGFMFNAKADANKIKAGLKWLTFRYNNPDRIAEQNKAAAEAKQVVGLPEPNIWTGDAKGKQDAATKQYATVKPEHFAAFAAATGVQLKLEPPMAQQIYAVLDTAMAKVLTDKDANIDALLADAEKQVNTILAAAK